MWPWFSDSCIKDHHRNVQPKKHFYFLYRHTFEPPELSATTSRRCSGWCGSSSIPVGSSFPAECNLFLRYLETENTLKPSVTFLLCRPSLSLCRGGLTSGVAGLLDFASALQQQVVDHEEVLSVTLQVKVLGCTNKFTSNYLSSHPDANV